MTALFDLLLNAEAKFLALSVEGQDFRREAFRLAESHYFSLCKCSSSAMETDSSLGSCLGREGC